MFCRKCGTQVPEDSHFCVKCGQATSVATSTGGAAAAVAPARIVTPAAPRPAVASRKFGRFIVPLLVLVVLVWIYLQQHIGVKATNQLFATVVHVPLELNNGVENLRAASWKGIALNLPYSGTVDVNLDVMNGNPVDVFLVNPDQIDIMKKELWRQVQVYPDFNATKARTYRRNIRLNQGSYYLIIRDTSLGILSASASDISVKVQLNP